MSRVRDSPHFETLLFAVAVDATVAHPHPGPARNAQRVLTGGTTCLVLRDRLAHREGRPARQRGRAARRGRPRASRRVSTRRRASASPTLVWNHDGPGELLSPKWQQCWKPVVCAVHGMCTVGVFYFVNEADVVVCSYDATFFDSHVTLRAACRRSSPIGLMRRIGLGDTLRMAPMATGERRAAETALRLGSGHRDRAARRSCGTTRTSSRAPSLPFRSRPRRARSGDLGVARQAVPGRDGPGPDLHPARQPDRSGRDRTHRRRPHVASSDPMKGTRS